MVEPEMFAHEITVLRFELFALAWLHQLGDKRVAAQSTFTKQYLEEKDRLDIWESMQPYNQAIAKSSHHGATSDTTWESDGRHHSSIGTFSGTSE